MKWMVAFLWLILVVLFIFQAPSFGEELYRVAILDEPAMPVFGCATPLTSFENVLSTCSASLTCLNAEQLSDPAVFNVDQFDLLIMPTGASFPVIAKATLLAFLQRGGDLFCTGGYAFDALWTKENGKWVSYFEQWQRKRLDAGSLNRIIPNGGFESGTDGWEASVANACSVIDKDAFEGHAYGQVTNTIPDGGESWQKTLDVTPGQSYLIGAQAKTNSLRGPGYAYMAVYQFDAKGALVAFIDFAQMQKTTDWKRYETLVAITPQTARTVFRGGLYLASGVIGFDAVTCALLPFEERINAHYGKPEDGLIVAPSQIMAYSPDQRLAGDALCAATDTGLPGDWRSPGAVTGYAATVQLNAQARWIPVVEARDHLNRFSGSAGAFVPHYAGLFANSTWALFGVTNRDLFTGPEGALLLRETIQRLHAGVWFQPLVTDARIYNRGENVQVKIPLYNSTAYPRTVRVELTFNAPKGEEDETFFPLHTETKEMTVAANGTETWAATWTVPQDCADFVRIHATLYSQEYLLDTVDSGICVRDKAIRARGVPIVYQDNAFVLDKGNGSQRKACLFGTDTYANMFLSPTQSPWTWWGDLRAMRANGLHLYENLQFPYTDAGLKPEQWNQIDALVQMSQRFGLPYMAGLLIGQDVMVDDVQLERQAAFCRTFAARYKDVPGLIYYLNGDFTLVLKNTPGIARHWNDFLRERYGTDEALRAAWGKRSPDAALGSLPVTDSPAQGWFDVRARDLAQFKVFMTQRWIHALCTAIRQEDTQHPITSEYYQKPFNGIDLRLSLGEMDAANFGYFDTPGNDIARLMATIKWNDMRFTGQTINIGEFGVKTHEAWTPERGAFNYHIRRTEFEEEQLFWWISHAAFAMGVTKIQNWCWADDGDRIFPWGLSWDNPKQAKTILKLYRNLSLASEQLQSAYTPADVVFVMPDSWRLGAPEAFANTALMNALECLLATNVAFDVANESHLDRVLQRKPKLVLMPFAYALSDQILAQLRQLAERGSVVYLSGDPSIDSRGVRQPDRLATFLGVRFENEKIAASGMPVPVVIGERAALREEQGDWHLFETPCGSGRILWSPEPWETFTGSDLFLENPGLTSDPAHNRYYAVLRCAAIVPPVQIEAKEGVWRAIVTPSGPNRLITLFPRSTVIAPTTVMLNVEELGLRFDINLPVPSSVLIDRTGNPLMATGSGAIAVNGVRCAQGEGAWMVFALDGFPLAQSKQVAVCSNVPGQVCWASQVSGLPACLAEHRDGKIRSVAAVPIECNGQSYTLRVEPNELYVVAPKDALQP